MYRRNNDKMITYFYVTRVLIMSKVERHAKVKAESQNRVRACPRTQHDDDSNSESKANCE